MIPPSQQTELRAGVILGRYELLLPIAKGGMAQVWAARLRGSRGFQKLVAIKTILPEVLDNTRMERMFLEEAQLASQIHHPNVVGTLELGEHEGTLYLVMEWVDGEPLHQVMAKAASQGGLPLAIGVNLIGQACKGLFAAHELRDDAGELLGLVHRDVSPQNLLVSFSGTAKLVDFGIAKVTARSSGLTEAGEVKGKFAFMAPEQVRGHAVDCRTDLFALGILLYAITTGKHPFRGAHPGETLQNICSDRAPVPPSAFISDYPTALEEVVMKALSKSPDGRFGNANEMLEALERAMPEPLEPSFEVDIAAYLRELFGAHASARRAAIREAQEHADRQRADSSASSVGTLRAISIDRQDSGSFSVQPATVRSSMPSASPTLVLQPSSRLPQKLAALGLVAGVGLAAFVLRGAAVSAPASSAAGSAPVALEALSAPSVVAARSSAEAAAPSVKATSVEAPEPAAHEKSEKGERKASRARGVVVAPKAAATTASEPTAQPTTPAAPSAAPAAATPSANAWDRGAFGGRH